jgi:hypothetical protein
MNRAFTRTHVLKVFPPVEWVSHAGLPCRVVLLKYPSLFSVALNVLQIFLNPTL